MASEDSLDHPDFYWHLELTNKCMLKCPRCPRTEAKGMYQVTEMDLEFVKKIFTQERLTKMRRLLLCGGEGDPIYCTDFLEIIRFLKDSKPDLEIKIITNGSYKKTDWWRELGRMLNSYDSLIFSIDGWDQQSNEAYRVNSNWQSIIEGVQSVQPTRAHIIWSTIYFKFNQDKIFHIRDLARALGFDAHLLVYSTLFGHRLKRYIDPELQLDPLQPDQDKLSRGGRHIKTLEPLSDKLKMSNDFEKIYLERTKEVQRVSRDWIVSPLCKTGHRALYVSAEGFLYPCSWVSHPFHGLKKSKLRENVSTTWEESYFIRSREQFNLRNHDVEQVLNDPFWKMTQKRWQSSDQTPLTCEDKCLNTCRGENQHNEMEVS